MYEIVIIACLYDYYRVGPFVQVQERVGIVF